MDQQSFESLVNSEMSLCEYMSSAVRGTQAFIASDKSEKFSLKTSFKILRTSSIYTLV